MPITKSNEIQEMVSSAWSKLNLPRAAIETSKKGLYFDIIPPTAPNLLILSLNNIIYTQDWRIECEKKYTVQYCENERGDDPFDQFAWLIERLQFARSSSLKSVHFTIF